MEPLGDAFVAHKKRDSRNTGETYEVVDPPKSGCRQACGLARDEAPSARRERDA